MYRDTLRNMTIAQLREEAKKYPEVEIVSSDNKEDIIKKISIAYYSMDKGKIEIKNLTQMPFEPVPTEDFKRGKDIYIGFDGEEDEDDFLTVEDKVQRELWNSKANSSTILTADLKSYWKRPTEDGQIEFFIQGEYGPTHRLIFVPFDEYKLELRSSLEVELDSTKANEVNAKANRYVLPKEMTDEKIGAFINRRAFSKFNFKVLEMDDTNNYGTVLGSRLEIAKRERLKWDRMVVRDGKSEFYIKPGVKLKTRIVETLPYGIYVEAFGYEFFIPKAELSYNPRMNCTLKKEFRPGQKLPTLVKSVNRNKKGEFISACLPYVALTQDPRPEIVERMFEKQVVYGIVMDQEKDPTFGYRFYIEYSNGVNIACRTDRRVGAIPHLGDKVAVKISQLNREKGQARGYIQHIYPDVEDDSEFLSRNGGDYRD